MYMRKGNTMARKIKISESVKHHSDVNVRLAADQLLKAVEAAKRGDVSDMATFIRLARMFENDIPNEFRFAEKR